MKRLIALLLTLVLVFPVLSQLCIAAEAADKKKDTAEETEEIRAYAPLMDTVEDAELVYGKLTEEGTANVVYMPADEDTLDYFMYLCNICGLYGAETETEDKNLIAYELFAPGTTHRCVLCLDKEEETMIFSVPDTLYPVLQEDVEKELEYYEQEISFPAKFGKNVFPQFFASIGKSQPMGNIVSEVDYAFDGAECWMERYSGIPYAAFQKYIFEMILCGFSIEIDGGSVKDGKLVTTIFHFDNGDAEVIVVYDSEDETASVYYEPGVTYYLLSGKEYKKYIPQK